MFPEYKFNVTSTGFLTPISKTASNLTCYEKNCFYKSKRWGR